MSTDNNDLAKLHHISLKKNDSKCVREAVKHLYKHDIEKLKNRSVRGSKKKERHKTAVDTRKSHYDQEFVSWTTVARNFHAGYGNTMLPVVLKPIDVGRNRQYYEKTHCA